jgi:hypothetical protein
MIATLHYFLMAFRFDGVSYRALKVLAHGGGRNYGADFAENIRFSVMPALDEEKRRVGRS